MSVLQRYTSYKYTGIKWLGDIPSHWSLKKLKHISYVNPTAEKSSKSDHVTFLPMEAVTPLGEIDCRREGIRSNFSAGLTKFIKNDVIVAKITPCFENGKGACLTNLKSKKGIGSTEFHVLRAHKETNNKYLYYLTQNAEFRNYAEFFMEGSAGQKRVTTPLLANTPCPNPPLNEQVKIASFLDRKTAEIDESISKKNNLIDLLKEQKVIVITQAITKGINPNASMKDSGVEWIGHIPEHWEVRRSKYLFAQRKERAWKDDIQLSATQAYGVIPQEEYEARVGRKVVRIQLHLDKRKHVEKDDFVISMRSFQGGLERAWARGCIRSSYVVLRPLQEIDAGFYSYLLKLPSYIKALQRTASFIRDGQDLSFDNFSQVTLFIPPLEEQEEIQRQVTLCTAQIDEIILKTKEEISKIKELRQVIISEVVTGKVRV